MFAPPIPARFIPGFRQALVGRHWSVAMSAIELIRNTLVRDTPHLGDIVWWTLADARTPRADLEQVWRDAGLAAEYLPELPSSDRSLRVAAREAAVGQTDRLLRLAKADESETVFAVVHEDRPGDGTVAYTQEARITLDRRADVFSSDDPTHEMVAAVRHRFEILRLTHTVDEIRRAVLRSLQSFAAVTLREGGGVYWVPFLFSAQLRRLQAAIAQIGSSQIYLLPVHRNGDAEKTLSAVAKGSLEAELAALSVEVEEFLAAPPERQSTLTRRLEMFDDLSARAGLYEMVLKGNLDGIRQKLENLTSSVESMLADRAA